MDNPDDEKTIINVKAVSVSAWERAKKAALKNGETLGSWVSRACDQLANLEAGERYIPPANPGQATPLSHANLPANPGPVPHVDFREVAAILVAMKEAGLPVQKRIGGHVNALLNTQLRDVRGLGPEKAGRGRPFPQISHGLTEPENGKAITQSLDC